ncbi:hypothetical protein Tco_1483260, partial [Tanacetum coccineum]
VHRYQVILLSVSKLAKDNKLSVCFNEKDYVIQDSVLKSQVGTGSKKDGLYLLNLVLYALKNDIDIKGDFFSERCDVYHRAKQTTKPFPLSDHKSTTIDQLIHLDVWGPYKIRSKDGHRFFLTIVDDYSRAISNDLNDDVRDNSEGGGTNPSFVKPAVESTDANMSSTAKPSTNNKGTDISKIIRKQSKTGKHEHENQKNTKEAKDSKPKPEKSSLIINEHEYYSSPSPFHLAVKTRGKRKLRDKMDYSSGRIHGGKVKSVNPRQFISSLKLGSHGDMEKAQRNLGFYTKTTLKESTSCHNQRMTAWQSSSVHK